MRLASEALRLLGVVRVSEGSIEPGPPWIERFPLRPERRIGTGRVVFALVGSAILIQVWLATREIWPLVMLGVLLAVLLPLAAFFSRAKSTQPSVIEALPDRLHLPISSGTGTVPVRYRDVTALFLRDDPRGFLTVGTNLGSFIFPVKLFLDPAHPRRIEALVRQQLAALPDGEARLKVIDDKGAQAERTFAHPLRATIFVLVLLAICFAIERAGGAMDRAFSIVGFGAASRVLVLEGQWYRLFTASLLHGNEVHLLVNGLAIYSLGGAIERLYGSRNFGLVYMISAVFGAAFSVISNGASMSVGASTAAFGLLGAFAFTSFRYRERMPTGFQPPLSWWVWVIGLNLGLSLMVKVIDFPAHLGGFLGGVIAGALLIDGDRELPLRGSPPWWSSAIGAVLLVAHLVAIGFAIKAHGRSRDDETLLMAAVIDRESTSSSELNEIAWFTVTDPQAPRAQLELALKASKRGLVKVDAESSEEIAAAKDSALGSTLGDEWLEQIRAAATLSRLAIADTVATSEYRLGDHPGAIRRELEVLRVRRDRITASQLARFLRAQVEASGPLIEPGVGAVGTSTLGVSLGYESSRGFFVNIAPSADIPEAITAIGYVRSGEKLVGLLEVRVEPQSIAPKKIWLEQRNIFAAWPSDAALTVAYLSPNAVHGWFAASLDAEILSYP
jgi:membrane associated rhomboid family serine protease